MGIKDGISVEVEDGTCIGSEDGISVEIENGVCMGRAVGASEGDDVGACVGTVKFVPDSSTIPTTAKTLGSSSKTRVWLNTTLNSSADGARSSTKFDGQKHSFTVIIRLLLSLLLMIAKDRRRTASLKSFEFDAQPLQRPVT